MGTEVGTRPGENSQTSSKEANTSLTVCLLVAFSNFSSTVEVFHTGLIVVVVH